MDEWCRTVLGAFDTVCGMREPLILRGLLQLMVIAAFFVVRYILDVLLTPPVLDSLVCDVYDGALSAIPSICSLLRTCFAPLMPFVVFHVWKWCTANVIQRALFLLCSLRLATSIVMNDAVTIGRLTKEDVWPTLVPLVRFVRVSAGRVAERDVGPPMNAWFCGYRRLLCVVVPWLVRIAVLLALLRTTEMSLGISASGVLSLWAKMGGRQPESASLHPSGCICPEPHEVCTSFVGQPMACRELRLAREFNSRVMPTLQDASYRDIRRAMTEHGLYGSAWHVGHACPDPSKDSSTDNEDRGWNLFAQHAADNVRLGHCLVSCAEAQHARALHVRCTRSPRCVASCDDPGVTYSGA